MKRYELLLFDADGTILDYDAGERQALGATLASCSLPRTPEVLQLYRQINSGLWKSFERGEIRAEEIKTERFRQLFTAAGSDADPREAGALYLEHLGKTGFLMPGARELLTLLRPDFRLALITNGITRTQYGRLEAAGIRDCFDPVIISEEVGVQKPDPGIFSLLFRRAGHARKETALIIGDSLTSDMAGGIGFGIDTCWFNPNKQPRNPEIPVTWEIHRLAELPALLSG
jgi:2-haloacid dehalogenase